MPGSVVVSGQWKDVNNLWIAVGNQWKDATAAWIMINGTWQQWWPAESGDSVDASLKSAIADLYMDSL